MDNPLQCAHIATKCLTFIIINRVNTDCSFVVTGD